jgi:hypothetical protein
MVYVSKVENTLEETLFSNYIIKNYSFSLLNINVISTINIKDILEEEFNDIKEYKFSNNYEEYKYLQNNDFLITVKSNSEIKILDIYTKDLENLTKLSEIVNNFKYNNSNLHKLFFHKLFYNLKGGFIIKKKEITLDQITHITEEYYPYIENVNNLFKNFKLSNEQIIFINGDIGTGKTKFSTLYLNYLHNNLKQDINVISIDNISIVDKDEFWLYIEDKEIDLIVLDDVDGIETNKEFVSKILNYTDGMLKNKTKFIISGASINFSNLNKGFRDNRVFKFLTFRDLSKDEAKNIWLSHNLNIDIFNTLFKSSKIKKSLLSKKIFELTNNIMNEYKISEDIEKSNNSKLIGFNK